MRRVLSVGLLIAFLMRVLLGIQNHVANEDVLRAVAGSACQVQMLNHILSSALEKVTTVHLQKGHLFQTMF